VTGPLQWQPGDKYAYGNQGMNVAARVVEVVSGMPYEELFPPAETKGGRRWRRIHDCGRHTHGQSVG